MKITLEKLHPDKDANRLTWYDEDGSVTDIMEGPARWLITRIIWAWLSNRFAVRKVH